MAITGVVGMRAAEYAYSTNSYSSAFHIGDAINVNLSVTMVEGSLYANNKRKEYKQKFDTGSIQNSVDDITDTVEAKLLGHSTTSVTVGTSTVTAVVSNENDKAPELGVGFYQTVTRNGADKFRVVVLRRVVYGEPEDNAETMDNTIKFNGRTITGTILSDKNGDWKTDVTVDSAAEAEAFLDAVLGTAS